MAKSKSELSRRPPQPASKEQPSHSSHSWFSLSNLLIGLFVGTLLGILGAFYLKGWLPKITELLLTASYIAFGVLVVSLIAIFGFRDYIARSIFGTSAARAGTTLQDAQKAGDYLTDRVADQLLKDAPEDVRQGARSLLPRLTNLLLWARLRNWWWQWLFGIFVAIGGLAGTVLLNNQNELLNNQNALIQRQMSLEEANRRSALVVLMSNIMDKVDREIEQQRNALPEGARDSARFYLSQSLIGQIAALSHSFKPYRYLDGDTLIPIPLSPERGQLLITLSLLPLDTSAFNKIYKSSTFELADLRKAVLTQKYLCGANLSYVDLTDAYLPFANLREANLSNARLIDAYLPFADLREANLSNARLIDADLPYVNMQEANLNFAKLYNSDISNSDLKKSSLAFVEMQHGKLHGVDLTNAILSFAKLQNANLSEAKLNFTILTFAEMQNANLTNCDLSSSNISYDQLNSVISLYKAIFQDSIKVLLLRTHPQLFNPPDTLKNPSIFSE